jgi:hypothetical protein
VKPGKPLKNVMDRPFEVKQSTTRVRPLKNVMDRPFEVKQSTSRARPLKNVMDRPFEVKQSTTRSRPFRLGTAPEPTVRLAGVRKDKKSPRFALADNLVVRKSREQSKARRPLRVGPASFGVAMPKGNLAPATRNGRATACRATLRNGKRCPNKAQQNSAYCVQHKSYVPRTETVVMRDTRRRSSFGVGEQKVAKGRR